MNYPVEPLNRPEQKRFVIPTLQRGLGDPSPQTLKVKRGRIDTATVASSSSHERIFGEAPVMTIQVGRFTGVSDRIWILSMTVNA